MAASTDSEQSGAIVEQTFAATAVMETFEMPDLYDDLSSEDDETVEAQRIAELEALVSSLTTPPEHFSAKIGAICHFFHHFVTFSITFVTLSITVSIILSLFPSFSLRSERVRRAVRGDCGDRK